MSYAISHRLHKSAHPTIALTGLEIAALLNWQTLQNAIEIDLIVQGVLEVTETRTSLLSYFSKLQTRFTGPGLKYPLNDLQRWALAKLVAANSLVWTGNPSLNVVANEGFYSRHRKTMGQMGWLLPDNALLKQQIMAITPFIVPLVLILLWLKMRGVTSTMIVIELFATVLAAIFAASHQISLTPVAYSRFKQIRAEMRAKTGPNLQRKDYVMAFAVIGYSAFYETELERFAKCRDKEQNPA